MSAQQLDEERVFHTARLLPTREAVADYLEQVCAGDQALRERVEALLAVHEKEQSFLKSANDPGPTVDHPSITEAPGQQIGRYKLLQKIGEGGFGVVYMAEQTKPVRRKVALKVIKPGMDTDAVVARFEAERQALAMMDHLNIARVLDGGATESGRPYFVMELVNGVPITEYCDKNQFPTEDRLRLFSTVCQAVQHAHQKGIIHRDLKPSNVLVTLADGEPVVKVIDFGVAKAISQQLTEKTLFTAYGQMIGTPQYMSPEQAEMSCLDVDTRSDVYSLGVLLYELLTGTTPLEADRLRTAGYAEMQRLIREDEPPKPSTRLSTSGEQLTVIAKHRAVSPDKLKSQIKGDLDWIVMKALEKDRTRRYGTPSSFADDVSNFLNDEPVDARSPTLVYKATKYLRRNRITIASICVLFVLLSVGLASFAHQAEVERQLKDAAISAAEQATGEKKRADDAIGLVRNEILDRALEAAVRGDKHQLDLMLSKAEPLQLANEWQHFLRGLGEFYAGRISQAQEHFEASIDQRSDNPAAVALASICALWESDVANTHTRLSQLSGVSDRPEYAEYDKTFRAFAELYVSPEHAMGTLGQVLEDRPFSITTRLFFAGSLAHTALITGNASYAEKAADEMEVIRRIVGDPPVVAMFDLFICTVAIDLLEERGGSTKMLREKATVLSNNANLGVDFPLWHAVQAVYLDTVGKDEKSFEEWQRAATSGVYVEPYAIQSVMCGREKEAKDKIERPTSLCHAFLSAESSNDRNQLVDRISSSLENGVSDYEHLRGVHALLYLGELSRAVEASKHLPGRLNPGPYLEQLSPYSYLIGDESDEDLLRECRGSRLEQEKAYWLIALKHFAEGDREKAESAFNACSLQGQINSPRHYIARAIRDRLRENRDWPTWIQPKVEEQIGK